ncbi:LPS translocon maturation chaperone LptM [Pokkaliibacter sp. CJK22405]
MRIVCALLILSSIFIAGCGNKGPLYMPQQDSSTATSAQ